LFLPDISHKRRTTILLNSSGYIVPESASDFINFLLLFPQILYIDCSKAPKILSIIRNKLLHIFCFQKFQEPSKRVRNRYIPANTTPKSVNEKCMWVNAQDCHSLR